MKTILNLGLALALTVSLSISASGASLPARDPVGFRMTFTGPEEAVAFPPANIQYTPDENISFLRSDQSTYVWLQGFIAGQVTGQSTYYFIGTSFEDLAPHQTTNGMAVPVLKPSGSGFDANYAGSAAVMQASSGTGLLMFYHGENHKCHSVDARNTIAGIGLARLSAGESTWERVGQIISSPEMPTDCNFYGFRGAGNPSVLTSRDGQYIYLYFMEWVSGHTYDSISLARALVSSDGVPGAWYKYKDGEFKEPGLGGQSDPVILPHDLEAGFAGIPNVSFNTYLNRYLAIFVGHNGFYYASSLDGIHWNRSKLLWEVPAVTIIDRLNPGDHWYYYPTLLSLDQKTDDITTQTAYLYYAHGTKGTPHFLARRPIKISYLLHLPSRPYQHVPR